MPTRNPLPVLLGIHALLTVALGGCGGPFVVFPGGALDGSVELTPESFAFARDTGTVQLETDPEDPYSVNIHGCVVGDDLYVSAGDNEARWVQNIEANPLVRVRIEDDIYELRARRVTDAAEMDAFAEAWLRNAWARDPRQFEEVWVYQLAAR